MPPGAELARLAWRDLRASGAHLWVLCACLALGVTLIAASGGLYQQVSRGLLADTRALFGGDLEVRDRKPLDERTLAWMQARGEVSLLVEFRTMLRTDGGLQLVELHSYDDAYPLYGEVTLQPPAPLARVLAHRDGQWGIAIDPVLARRLDLAPGDRAALGGIEVEVRALIERQPDRSLRADWRGLPVLIAAGALPQTGLIGPGSNVAWRYRVKLDGDANAWRSALGAAFPDSQFEVRSFANRGERIGEVLGQLASGLLLISFSALFIGGLGVFNSVHAYLQAKLATIATLRALGLRDRRLAMVYLLQVLLLAGGASLAGVIAGGALALAGTAMAAGHLPVAPTLRALAAPLALAWLFGVLTALSFAMPALGRSLSISPAALFRGIDGARTRTPRAYWWMTGALAAVTVAAVLLAIPDPAFGAGFVLVVMLLLAVLELVVRALRALAPRLAEWPRLAGQFALRLALANLYRPGSPLRPLLLSLGCALTVLVASALVVAALLRAVNDTIPEQAPALVIYDVPAPERATFRALVASARGVQRLDLVPLVLGRLASVNGESLRNSADPVRAMESRDEHKLSYRTGNDDNIDVQRGAWWPPDYAGPPLVAMEDREADQLGLSVGDRLRFEIMGEPVEARLAAIYGQRRFQSRFWLEAIFTDGVLDPFITRYVGAAFMDTQGAIEAQERVAQAMPGVVTIRTAAMLAEARALLARASAGLAVVGAISLLASMLVLVSVVASTRARQVYDATVLHILGTRIGEVRRALRAEYALIALLTSLFAVPLGSAIAIALLRYRLELPADPAWWLGVVTALGVSIFSLTLGARYLLRRLRVAPAALLRAAG